MSYYSSLAVVGGIIAGGSIGLLIIKYKNRKLVYTLKSEAADLAKKEEVDNNLNVDTRYHASNLLNEV